MQKNIIVLLLTLAICKPLYANQAVNDIESTMVRLCRLNPRHKVLRDPQWRNKLAVSIVEAAERYHEDPYLLLTIIWCESTLRPHARGKLGEKGLGQVHGVAARGCDLGTVKGQLLCTAKWLHYSRTRCNGTDGQALARYATGRTCKPRTGSRLSRLVRRRLRIYKGIKIR